MKGAGYVFIVISVCYLIILAMEYYRFVQGQNWPTSTATVQKSANSLPFDKFMSSRMDGMATFINWSYIRYNYSVNEGRYDAEKELGPHLTSFDFYIGTMAERFPEGTRFNVRVNPRDPKESCVGFEVFKPLEMLGGSALVFGILGTVLLYLANITSTTTGDDAELDQPIEYFEKKYRKY
ncbi:MAG: DUF3592 domain-containing protein [Candidatus Obscuribacterales bacterium]|nr:DUF3592 domain-containing protein [Candidatus Obscuribacterales bacterium]